MVTERRTSPRISLVTLVDVTQGEKFFYDYSVTLCEGGMFVETKEGLASGETLRLRFTLPKIDHVFEAEARVAWINPKPGDPRTVRKFRGAGLRLTAMDAEDGKVYAEFLREKTKIAGAT